MMEPWYLSAHLLGELDADQRRELEDWLERNPERVDEMTGLSATIGRTQRVIRSRPDVRMAPLEEPWKSPSRGVSVAAMVAAVFIGAITAAGVSMWWLGDSGTSTQKAEVSGIMDGESAGSETAQQPLPELAASVPGPTPAASAVSSAKTTLPGGGTPSATDNAAPAKPVVPKAAPAPTPVKGPQTTVACVRDGKQVAEGVSVSVDGPGKATHKGEEIVVTGHAIGDTLKLRCWTTQGENASVTHRVRADREVVYLPLVAAPAKKAVSKKPKKGPGQLIISARPWAKCNVDNGPSKTTRFNAQVPSGIHTIRCSKSGQTKKRSVRVKAGQTKRVMFDFR